MDFSFTKREALTVVGCCIFLWLCYGGLMLLQDAREGMVARMTIHDVDLNSVADGFYVGAYKYSSNEVEVQVEVANHRMKEITILNNSPSTYAKKAEAVIDRVVEAQSLQVDTVSGATVTSKALLKAVERSFKKQVIR